MGIEATSSKGVKTMAYMAIETKYLGPTNYRGARIKATAMDTFSDEKRLSVTIPYQYELSAEAMHRLAAEQLMPKLVNDPDGVSMVAGATDRGYVFVITQQAKQE